MKATKIFNIWIAQVSLNNRKSCPQCSIKLDAGNCVVSVGEYVSGTYRHAFYACKACFAVTLYATLHAPMRPFALCYRSGQDRIAWVESFKEDHDIASHQD